MDSAVNAIVGQALVMQQAQAAQQVQLEVYKEALDMQKDQVQALMASASLDPQLASDGMLGTLINAYA
ncbi:putative motility protein [Billgrantia kenyensis]|uniref:Motility protein n=1 Tax=Billgrantia kenyensis TaxID=321266 RepID=A0A7V9W3I9_9GAMM|nr:putative motility protein [Halomonas kenyensis]MBA2780408.1 putative motility protein [Halomonas kenyensis]MCG6663384.1 putative motility protein [Halomonas kenyensis]